MIQKLGLVLFLMAFGLFVASLGMNEFKLTNEILAKNVKPEQLQDAEKQFAPMIGKTYPHLLGFLFGHE